MEEKSLTNGTSEPNPDLVDNSIVEPIVTIGHNAAGAVTLDPGKGYTMAEVIVTMEKMLLILGSQVAFPSSRAALVKPPPRTGLGRLFKP